MDEFPGIYCCAVCGTPYPTQREADLCTPAYMIPIRYGIESVTEEVIPGMPDGWLEDFD